MKIRSFGAVTARKAPAQTYKKALALHLCISKSGKFQPVAKEVKSMLTFPTWASLSFIATRYSRTSICDNESYVPRFLYVLFSLKRIYARTGDIQTLIKIHEIVPLSARRGIRRCGRPSARVVRRLEKESQTEQPRIDGGIAGFRSKRTSRSVETLLRHLDSAGRSTQKRQPRQPRPNRSRTDDHPLGDRLRPAKVRASSTACCRVFRPW